MKPIMKHLRPLFVAVFFLSFAPFGFAQEKPVAPKEPRITANEGNRQDQCDNPSKSHKSPPTSLHYGKGRECFHVSKEKPPLFDLENERRTRGVFPFKRDG